MKNKSGIAEVDCRKCKNCDMKNSCCKKYGSDPNLATKLCAND